MRLPCGIGAGHQDGWTTLLAHGDRSKCSSCSGNKQPVGCGGGDRRRGAIVAVDLVEDGSHGGCGFDTTVKERGADAAVKEGRKDLEQLFQHNRGGRRQKGSNDKQHDREGVEGGSLTAIAKD
ncbi:hypothetical protein B296_00010258 [Ensete ventricosum]|uniref:Uncharacterized protein n=1 Tax=Ensete ventricosum TaxID=4639 RepID=A0A426ZBQ5_ENSVE|nr:hypothetical protein B296_00010258 [Ensete ventricosum]